MDDILFSIFDNSTNSTSTIWLWFVKRRLSFFLLQSIWNLNFIGSLLSRHEWTRGVVMNKSGTSITGSKIISYLFSSMPLRICFWLRTKSKFQYCSLCEFKDNIEKKVKQQMLFSFTVSICRIHQKFLQKENINLL